ncbi:uncharacterized protein LOC112006872 [Quercus suber]|uniref:uncharacterized protein LOC112006872 n=1 Tax=Quercus suber TaxID=58331 RepID=UPI0032DEE7C3
MTNTFGIPNCNWGGGGDIGKKINDGGGDVNGDEDDYFDDFDDGNEGDGGGLFRRQKFLEELFGHKFVDAVLNEWQRTMMDLPAGFEKAYDMRAETLGIVEFPILGRISKFAISWDSLIRF